MAACLEAGRVHFGHGIGDARGEAHALATLVCSAGNWQRKALLDRRVSRAAQARARHLASLRVSRRIPLAYLIREAWFAGLRFHVDKRVCIPRSPIAELIQGGFAPWLGRAGAHRILELCTGSGCIAAACAFAFPDSEVVATDISPAALSVAQLNIRRLGVENRVTLLQGDLFAGAEGPFDLVISNPPYVPSGVYRSLPPEYRYEPRLALEAGANGLTIAERILDAVPDFLSGKGLLALEVGDVAPALMAACPELPLFWPDLHRGGHGVALLRAADITS